MTYAPGTADIFTTGDVPFPGELPRTTLTADFGWRIVLTELDAAHVMAQLIHPLHGMVASGTYPR